MKYLEKGHTFNAADSFHSSVETGMKGKGKLYDFNDFVEVINLYGIAVETNSTHFKLYQKAISQGKDTHSPLLCDVVEVCFEAKSTKIFWKERFADQEFKSGEFLQKKYRKLKNRAI